MNRKPRINWFIIAAVSLTVVAALGVTRLSETFSGDQALFTVYARAISEGAVLYGDLWDVKQPGVFLFYLVAGTLFGFSETGIHLFELLYWIVFSAILLFSLRWYIDSQPFLALAPVFTVGFYYLVSDSWRMTQIESLVGFPILLATLLMLNAGERKPSGTSRSIFLLSGLTWSTVLLFKSAYLIVIVAVSGVMLLYFLRRMPAFTLAECVRAVMLIAVGITTPLLIALVYFAYHGVLEELFYVTFLYPRDSVSTFSGWERIYFLHKGVSWFLWNYLPLIATIVLGAATELFRQKKSGKRPLQTMLFPETKSGLFTLFLVIWITSGIVAILIQAASWWGYHLMLLFVPLGLLAVKSLERIWLCLAEIRDRNTGLSKPILAGAAVTGIMLLLPLNENGMEMARRVISRKGIKVFKPEFFQPQGTYKDAYEQISAALAALPDTDPERHDMFVCSNPLYYYLADTSPGIFTNGWSPEFFMERQWRQFEVDLSEDMPKYLVIDDPCNEHILKNAPAAADIIAENYIPMAVPDEAKWYVRSEGL